MKSHKFKLDLSKVQGLDDKGDELKTSIEQEYSSLSITPRTFQARDYVDIDASAMFDSSGTILESVISSLKTILDSNYSDIQDMADELTQIGLVTIGKNKQIIGRSKKDVEKAKLSLIEVANGELAKLKEGVKKFESSVKVASIATIDHFVNPEGREVLKYGMNITPDMVGDINQFNSEVASKITALSVGSSSTGRSKKSADSKRSKVIEDTNKFIHFVELCLMKEALASLSKDKPVLVETFVRNAEGEIVFDDKRRLLDSDGNVIDKMPEVHTVLLYKMPDNQVLIIDPSNSDYTQHFVLGHNKKLIEQIAGEGGISLVTPSRKLQIYKHPDEVSVGSAANQARDCIDIAVKLAFEIMVYADQPLQDVDALKLWTPVIRITNLDVIDETMLIQNMAVRIKQSSEDKVRNKYFEINKKIASLKLIINGDKLLRDGLIAKYTEILECVENDIDKSYKDLLSSNVDFDNLKSVYDYVCDRLHEITEKELKEIDIMLIGTEEEVEI